MERRHLALADRHVAEAQLRITRQEALIRRMKQARRETALAEALLAALLTSHELFIEHRRLLVATIALAERAESANIGRYG
jgi:hypothetical protein